MKERLTGAIILVALLVLLVPELLTGPGHSAPVAHATNSDGAQMRSYTIDLAEDAAQKPASTPGAENPSPAPQPVPTAATSEAGRPASGAAGDSKSDDTKSEGSAETESAGAPGPEANDGAPGSASARPNGDAESASLAPARPESSAVVPKPQPSRTASPPRPVPSQPVSRVATAESPAGAGWAVQAGVFANRDNAERLARQLKGKGFAASVSESSGKGKRLWRVRVGPEPDRAAAVALGAKLRAAGQSGAVVSLP